MVVVVVVVVMVMDAHLLSTYSSHAEETCDVRNS